MGTPETDIRFQFVPFSEQQGENKRHTINLPVTFTEIPKFNDKQCPSCKASIRDELMEYKFGWGDPERLD